MKVTQLTEDLYTIGMEDRYLRVFRNEAFTEKGMRYAAYAVRTAEGLITLGSLPSRYAGEWAKAAAELAGEKGVRWAVLFGVDGDLAAWRALRERFPEAVLLAGDKTLCDLFAAGEKTEGAVAVRASRTLILGGKKLLFRVLTDRRESPSLSVLDPEEGVFWTADAFGADCALGATRVSDLADRAEYLRGAELYYADIYGRKRRRVMEKALALVRENGVRLICPAFGPVADTGLEELLAIYERPETPRGAKPSLAVAYLPAGGLDRLAESIALGAEESGEVEVTRLDLSQVSREEVLNAVRRSDALLLGSPKANKAVWDLLTSLEPEEVKGKLAAVFHTDGLTSEIPVSLRAFLERLGANLNTQDHFTTGTPTQADGKAAYEYGFSVSCLLRGVPNPRKPSLVKCLVCGEIFDASLGVCPVCGVGLDQCVPVAEDEALFQKNTDRRYVIVGGGVAAVSAAEAIRRRDETGEILLFSAESYLPINRPMLTKDLEAVRADPASLAIHPAEWYEKRNLDLRLGTAVTAVDTGARTVTTAAGEAVGYDKLIWAAGAECFVPPFEGKDKAGVITIRHLWDSEELQRRLKGAKNAVVIGGGVLGLEAASELMRQGVRVTVLEATPQIVGRQIDAESAAVLKGIMECMGVACHEGVSIAAITGEGEADGVLLADGRHFPADFVVVSCGNRANTGPMAAAGVKVNRAIAVNGRMETSAPDVYACGDCAELDGVNFQLWQEASSQGRAAGANAAGDSVTCTNELLGLSLEGFGTSLYAIGDPGKREGIPYRTVKTVDTVRSRRESYWYFGERLQGAVVIGAPEKTADIMSAVTAQKKYDEIGR